MFKNVGATFLRMAFKTTLVLRHEGGAPAPVDRAFMRRMTVGASHSALGHRMMAGQTELPANVRVTVEADVFLRTARVHGEARAETAGRGAARREAERRLDLATGFGMDTAWP